MAEQLPLLFEHKFNLTFANFYPGKNREIIGHLKDCVSGTGEQQIYLWGNLGLGKSHLLQACCQLAQELKKTTFYYSFVADALPSTEILSGLEEYEVVCFDNIDAIAETSDWELAFFNFYNRHRDRGFKLILSSNCPPNWLTIRLPDLKTRLNWGLTLKLQELSDQESIEALAFKAKQMGFEINPTVGRFLLSHYARDLASLWRLLDRLDHATLAAKRKLTLPFLKQFLSQDESD
ncbi:DnaA regulatory inactivator Hda [Methylotuvimicrobium buryatense]|uniref:DnaA regulatory inactivator Hda n=1 Tax=Methylotuvimicrobium buryatense TaxID=95641 RepID=A0A4P9UQV6_METBY|nr:DnaA regulatory inactivator Hda [Methylotuvimicrobium buryatense]QCW83842.1 DnaA regulatory inactivator Hda [Methylotuvimicrobium buryatense]